jgi:hypothetical protein
MTESESLFEDYCKQHGIKYERVVPGITKAPDYRIFVDGNKIVVEIKEITPNPLERQAIKQFDQYGTVRIKSKLGARIRGKITDAAGKFYEAVQNGVPSILVIYDGVRLHKHTSPVDILAGMYGELYFPVVGTQDSALQIGEIQSGHRKKMTPDHNTSMSAVAVLTKLNRGVLDLAVYHNCYARVPLDPLLISSFCRSQFRVNDQHNSTEWVRVDTP